MTRTLLTLSIALLAAAPAGGDPLGRLENMNVESGVRCVDTAPLDGPFAAQAVDTIKQQK
ncbi:MAG: hypothetical protein AB1635_12225 [Acidobacteriota bacterium]